MNLNVQVVKKFPKKGEMREAAELANNSLTSTPTATPTPHTTPGKSAAT